MVKIEDQRSKAGLPTPYAAKPRLLIFDLWVSPRCRTPIGFYNATCEREVMKLYTKHGDDGSTGLIGGTRVPKNDPRVAAYGDVDETNAAIGMVIAGSKDEETVVGLRRIQAELFVLGAELATPAGEQPRFRIGESHVKQLEHWIDAASAEVAPLRNFVLPGGTPTAAGLHLARTICRRAERAVVALAQMQPVGPWAIVYLNRLSDLLFALARQANKRSSVEDIPWHPPEEASSS